MKVAKKTLAITSLVLVCSLREIPAQAAVPENSLYTPILITLSNGETGSGFFVATSNRFFLATAAHVLFDKTTGKLRSNKADLTWWYPDNRTVHFHNDLRIDLGAFQTNNETRIHTTHDVAVVRLGLIINPEGTNVSEVIDLSKISVTSTNFNPMFTRSTDLQKLEDVNVGEDVYVFGYPGSVGLQQSPKFNYSKPLLRKGIVSGIYDQAQTIVIDAAVYFGNSGGPVMERHEIDLNTYTFKVIGVTSEIIPFVDIWENKRYEYTNINVSNSGYAVVEPSDAILQLLWND